MPYSHFKKSGFLLQYVTESVILAGVFSIYLAFFILPWGFPRVLPRVLDTNMLVSKTQGKKQGKHEKIAQREKTRENISILHHTDKNANKLRFSRVYLLITNANPMHSVIWALDFHPSKVGSVEFL